LFAESNEKEKKSVGCREVKQQEIKSNIETSSLFLEKKRIIIYSYCFT